MPDAAGTCHLVGCPNKGQHPPHGIGAGSWEDYQDKTPERPRLDDVMLASWESYALEDERQGKNFQAPPGALLALIAEVRISRSKQ